MSNKSRGCLSIIGGITVVLLGIGIIGSLSKKDDNNKTSKIGEVSAQNSNLSSDTDEQTGHTSENAMTPENKTEYHVGDILQTKDLKIIYTASGDYHSDNSLMQPDAGKKYIFIELFCENNTQSDENISSYDFKCYADGYSCDSAYFSENELSATLSPGRSTSGRVYFSVPEDAADIQIEYEVDIISEEKVIFVFDGKKDSGYVPDNHTTVTEEAFKVGDIISTSNLVIKYLSCGEYKSDNMFITPKDGYHYIYCEFEFENISDSDEYVSSYKFDCFADGASCDSFYGMENDLSATLSPKRKVKGTVAFEVPIDAKIVEVEYLTNYWTSDRIVFTYQ